MKTKFQTREQQIFVRLHELNWQTSGKKTHLFEEDFAFHIFNMPQNIFSFNRDRKSTYNHFAVLKIIQLFFVAYLLSKRKKRLFPQILLTS